ncbi:glycosyl hydrolase family 28-related protein [Jiangella asiatica]|uniref:glycosyl hydrolase family 28-related protein n=1 Tax=Jiangella asiatica TaxID=2530372 RepID=UPI0013A5C86F|nr:glycosyl hydrolase family 28-related protein [Jiangella asiatica]
MNRRHLLRTAGIAGVATATLGAVSASAQAAPADVANATTPQDFGAVGDGVADDTDAIQQAIDAQLTKANKIVYFPPGTYRITRTLVIPDIEHVENSPDFNRIVLAGAGTMGSRTSIIRVDFDGTGIACGAPLAAFRGLAFVVDSSQQNAVAIQTKRDDSLGQGISNSDDMDATITECTFVDFNIAAKHVGRGMVFTNNLVAVGNIGLDISWPVDGIKGDNVHVLPYGMRKWLIEGNHFHSMSFAITTTGADAHNFRGAIIANNVLDIGRRLFTGGIINSTFTGNVVENGATNATDASVISVKSGGSNLTFTGNVLGGGDPSGGARPRHAIEFRPEATARNVTITGNSFNWVDGSPVYFATAAAEVTVSANSFDNWNLLAEERWAAVRVNGDATDMSVIGNVFGANSVAGAPPVRVIGTLSGSTIVGNLFDNTAGVVYAEGIGDENYIERRSVGANQHELTAAKNGALVVRSTGALDPDADAFGSFVAASEQATGAGPGVKGGVRVVPANESGAAAVELLCSTNDSNGVPAMRVDINGLIPTADNVRDIGSADRKIRTVFAHNLQLTAVPAAELPEPTPGAVALVQDTSTRAGLLAIADGTSWRHLPLGSPVRNS